jgi:MobA/MobL family
MAIFHLSAVIHSRGKGHSAIAGAAYRSRSEMTDERTGERHDYSRKSADVLFAGMYGPKDAPDWTKDRAQLWQHVEAFEKRRDAQLARVFDIALPHELTLEQNRRLLQDWVRENFTRKGLIADAVIHGPDRGGDPRNTHAHVAVVLRKLDGTEFAAKKERTETAAERLGQLEGWRESWEKLANRHLERAGHDARIDRRTLKEQGIDAEPTQHLGPTANEMERKQRLSSERGAANHEITERNADRQELAALEAEERKLTAEIIDLQAERAKREAQDVPNGRYDALDATHQQVAHDEQFPEQPGQYDALNAATPPPEIVQQFEASATRATEPVAPVYDRDADNAAWEAALTEAAIASDGPARPEPKPEREGEALQPPGEAIATHPASPENAPEVTAMRPNVAPDVEITGNAASGVKDPERAASGIFGGVARFVENILGGLFGFFEPAAPKLTPYQAELAARAHDEQSVAAATAREAAEREAAFQATLNQIMRDDQQRRMENYSRYGTEIDRPAERGDPGPERDRD